MSSASKMALSPICYNYIMVDNPLIKNYLKTATIIFVVAISYLVTGFVGLSLISTSPGYATPIWIPSGIALGTTLIWGLRTLPGVFLGSLFVNYYVSTNPEIYLGSSFGLIIGCIIATGAVMQTIAGWYLIKKSVGLENPLNYPIDILKFALLSGPLASLVNTTWSNTILFIFNVLPANQYLLAWITWWIGDSIGVLTITPVFLILFAKPRHIWRARIAPILLPLCCSFIAVIIIDLIANASGIRDHLWSVLSVGLLFCVLINIVLFIVQGQKNILQKSINEQTSALKFEETKNLLILRSAGEGIFGIDNDGKITFINPAAANMLRYEETELLGKSLKHIVQPDRRRQNRILPTISAIIKSNRKYRARNEIFRRKDGTCFPAEYISSPLIDNNKNIGSVIVFNDITQQLEMQLNLEKMAHYDILTGLPNRFSFLQKLNEVLEFAKLNQRIIAICFIDVDNFKQINDNLGHGVGDEILKAISKLLKQELTKMDYLARLGGDEFAIILENIITIDSIKLTLQRFIKRLNKPIKVNHHEIMSSISIGIATYPIAGKTTEELIINADIAMYKAKEFGKNTFAFFDEEVSKQVKRRNKMDAEMHNAILEEEFSLVYQPFIEVKTKQLLGFEVLLRWHNSALGDISPVEFIPLAEKNGMIHKLGDWVLKQACDDYQQIAMKFKDNNLLMSINVSVVQLENDKFIGKITTILSESGMSSCNLIFELTETAIMQQPIHTINIMKDVRKLGIRFALDDFGVSYSSMQYLKILPISLLKVDKIFIRDLATDKDDIAIVKAIIQLAQALGISTVAEGVETENQVRILQLVGCEYMQGLYFSEPMTLQLLFQKQNMFR